jgi:hypothetical protein
VYGTRFTHNPDKLISKVLNELTKLSAQFWTEVVYEINEFLEKMAVERCSGLRRAYYSLINPWAFGIDPDPKPYPYDSGYDSSIEFPLIHCFALPGSKLDEETIIWWLTALKPWGLDKEFRDRIAKKLIRWKYARESGMGFVITADDYHIMPSYICHLNNCSRQVFNSIFSDDTGKFWNELWYKTKSKVKIVLKFHYDVDFNNIYVKNIKPDSNIVHLIKYLKKDDQQFIENLNSILKNPAVEIDLLCKPEFYFVVTEKDDVYLYHWLKLIDITFKTKKERCEFGEVFILFDYDRVEKIVNSNITIKQFINKYKTELIKYVEEELRKSKDEEWGF